MSVSLGISACLSRFKFGTALGDRSSVRITIGMVEHIPQLFDQFLAENVLDFFRITVDVVGGDAGFLGEV